MEAFQLSDHRLRARWVARGLDWPLSDDPRYPKGRD